MSDTNSTVADDGATPLCAEQYSNRGCSLPLGHHGTHRFYREMFDGVQGLRNIYHAITGKSCERYVALGMATSAVSALKQENEALRNALEMADKEASVAHDAIWSNEVASAGILHDSERTDSANAAIWRLHKAARAALKGDGDGSK